MKLSTALIETYERAQTSYQARQRPYTTRSSQKPPSVVCHDFQAREPAADEGSHVSDSSEGDLDVDISDDSSSDDEPLSDDEQFLDDGTISEGDISLDP